MFISLLTLSRCFPQSSACGEHPRGHLLPRQQHIPPPSLCGAVQLTGPSYAGRRDSFPAVAPQLV